MMPRHENRNSLRQSKTFDENPMLSINIKVWKYFAVILKRNRRVFGFVIPVLIMNAMQFVYLYGMWGDLVPFILNTFYAASIFNALLRTCLVIKNRNEFEAFMYVFNELYFEIETSYDDYAKKCLDDATRISRKITIFNLTACFCDVVGALFVPVFSKLKVHPFGVAIPGIDLTKSPAYEIFYILQIPSPVILTAMYMPFVSLFAAFAMFGKVMLIILEKRLKNIGQNSYKKDEENMRELKSCIEYYGKINRYVKDFNSLVTYIVGVEFLLFSVIICLLLFCINIVESHTQIFTLAMYIFTMLFVLFTYYWHANELMVESLKVAEAAYDIKWYHCSSNFKRTLLLFIIRCQMPLKIMVGNIYPMTLETFQSLLNASFSYFTLLRGVHDK